MKPTKYLTTILSLSFIAHCATAPKVVDTAALKAKSQAERAQAFKDNEIVPGGVFTPYKIGANTLAGEALSPLFDAPYVSAHTKSIYSSGETWNTFAIIFGAAGGGMIGWNIGTSARGADANVALWIGGGVSLAASFLFAGAADSKFAAASRLYNDDLYKALDLQQKTSAIKPQEQFAHYSMSMQHAF